MATLTPYIFSQNAREQAAFYVECLGGEIGNVGTFGDLPNTPEHMKDRVLHLELKAAGVPIFMCDAEAEDTVIGKGLTLSLTFPTEDEVYAAFDKLAEGGKVTQPVRKEFWGALFGQLTDKFGIQWMITSEAPPQP
ncbi:VOC family protein [Cohnella boryungensis]|uniref:VOC family protein n=1 Tax=Cohnella boryungensis TaxID=768479 RepID=A0ABV8S9A0_9BACL